MDLASRARIKKGLDSGRIMEWQKRTQEAKKAGQNDLFGGQNELPPLELEEAEPWTVMEALEAERKAVGFYLPGHHPLDEFFEKLDYALQLNEAKRQNDIKYGSHLLNRRHEGVKRNGRKFK